MPVSLNVVASLVSQLDSVLDDFKHRISSIIVDGTVSQVQLNPELFLTEFVDFDITVNEEMSYPFRLTASIGGVAFFVLLNASEIVDLKTTIPSQWEYIQRKLQVVKP